MSSEASITVYDPDAPPVIVGVTAPTGPVLITDPVVVIARFDDASVPQDSFTATVDWDEGDGPQPVAGITEPTVAELGTFEVANSYRAPGTYDVIVRVTDEDGNFDEERVTVEVAAPDGDPLITQVVGPLTPQAITEPVQISAVFSDDSGAFDTYTATVDWGDGSPAAVANVLMSSGETIGTIDAERIYTTPGVYTVTVEVSDLAGASDSEVFEFVVVFDPDTRGRVSGSGLLLVRGRRSARWLELGRASLLRLRRPVPQKRRCSIGGTYLRLVGDFYFRSTSYDYLIVNDAIAIAEGTGKISGREYRFRVQGIDNGRLDFFQITIWDPATDQVVYDNGVLYDKGDLVLLGGIKVRS